MSPWIQAAGVVLLAVLGVILGKWFSRLAPPYWLIGYVVPLVLVLLYGLANHKPALYFLPPFSWLVMGRNKFASIALISTMVLTTPLSRMNNKRARVLISVLMTLIVIHTSVWPFLAPAFNRQYLAHLRTRVDENGICIQSNDYNCGPAAAVTALRRLGFPADEGQIAILAHTSSATGTPPDILASALAERYGKEGLLSQFRVFNKIEELKDAGLTLAVIRYTFWLDHYVVVFKVTDTNVIVGDPSVGMTAFSRTEFARRWRYVGVTLTRKTLRHHAPGDGISV